MYVYTYFHILIHTHICISTCIPAGQCCRTLPVQKIQVKSYTITYATYIRGSYTYEEAVQTRLALNYLVALHHVLAVSSGTGKAKPYAEMPKTAWVRFANKSSPSTLGTFRSTSTCECGLPLSLWVGIGAAELPQSRQDQVLNINSTGSVYYVLYIHRSMYKSVAYNRQVRMMCTR